MQQLSLSQLRRHMKRLLVLTAFLTSVVGIHAQTQYQLDRSHSNVLFTVSHLIVSEVTGSFRDFDATITTMKEDFSDAVVQVNIKTASIDTDNERRDNHLRSDDFFLSEKHPEITFKSRSFRKTGDKTFVISGDLTMRGITKAIDLDAVYNGEVKDPWGNIKTGWKATGRVNRFDYGLKWNSLMETGGAVVGQDVDITINAEFLKKN